MISLGRDCFVLVLLLLSVITILQQHTTSADADPAGILMSFKANITGDPNDVLQSWDPTTASLCTWFHVTCDSNNKLVKIDLGNSGLSGRLIPELGDLSSLQKMELYNNSFTGNIPDEFGNLASLTDMDLYENNLTGPIPLTLIQLNNLKYLRLNKNNLSGMVALKTFLPIIQRRGIVDLSDNPFLCGPLADRKCP